jgi:uncharacterized cupin superfamily protein
MPSAAATKSRPKVSPQKVTAQKVAHARAAEPVLVKGRRDFFKYRDLGVADASAGALRAQFIYMLEGWVDLEFEDGRTIRVEKGDSLFIPGYLRHNEIRTSDKMEILEVSSPGQMGTTPCDPPAGFSRP